MVRKSNNITRTWKRTYWKRGRGRGHIGNLWNDAWFPEPLSSPAVFSGVRVIRSLDFCVVFCRCSVVCSFVLCLLDIVLSLLLSVFSGVRVIRSLDFCVVFCRCGVVCSFVFFFFSNCVVCLSSIYGFWLSPFCIFKLFLFLFFLQQWNLAVVKNFLALLDKHTIRNDYIIDENKIDMHSLRNRQEKLANDSLFCMF